MKFKVGDRVIVKKAYTNWYLSGTIRYIYTNSDSYRVKWDDGFSATINESHLKQIYDNEPNNIMKDLL